MSSHAPLRSKPVFSMDGRCRWFDRDAVGFGCGHRSSHAANGNDRCPSQPGRPARNTANGSGIGECVRRFCARHAVASHGHLAVHKLRSRRVGIAALVGVVVDAHQTELCLQASACLFAWQLIQLSFDLAVGAMSAASVRSNFATSPPARTQRSMVRVLCVAHRCQILHLQPSRFDPSSYQRPKP